MISNTLFFAVFNTQSPRHSFDIVPTAKKVYISRHDFKLTHFKIKHHHFK